MTKQLFAKHRWRRLVLAVCVIVIVILIAVAVITARNENQVSARSVVVQPPDDDGVVWYATHEVGDLSEWGTKPSNSGVCRRPPTGVSQTHSHTGRYAMEMTIDSHYYNPLNRLIPRTSANSGCRQFRFPEIRSGEPYYFSAWYYLPEQYSINDWAQIMQFKSERDRASDDPIWSVGVENRSTGEMYLVMRWNGRMQGPRQTDTDAKRQEFTQEITNLPVNTWFHLEVFLRQAEDFSGHVTVWQDDKLIFDFAQVKTRYPGKINTWSVNAYGGNIDPQWFTVFIDDVGISTKRLGTGYTRQ